MRLRPPPARDYPRPIADPRQGRRHRIGGSEGTGRRRYGWPGAALFPRALEHDLDAGPVDRGGAELEKEVDRVAPVDARDLRDVAADLLGHDRIGDAERRLPIAVLRIDID